MFREQAYILTGERRGGVWLLRRHCPRQGQPSTVEADGNWALHREETRGDVLGFLHTHPPRAGTVPSARDIKTMRAWCLAFGKPLLCVIQCQDAISSTLFYHEKDTGRALPRTQIFARGIVVAVEADINNGTSIPPRKGSSSHYDD